MARGESGGESGGFTLAFAPSVASRAQLDLADCARSAFVSNDASSGDLESVLGAGPHFVVVGTKSAGKSSVLSRLSGVTFPQSSERCMRIDILLKLRRGDEA